MSSPAAPAIGPNDNANAFAARMLEFMERSESYNRQLTQSFTRFVQTGVFELPPEPFPQACEQPDYATT